MFGRLSPVTTVKVEAGVGSVGQDTTTRHVTASTPALADGAAAIAAALMQLMSRSKAEGAASSVNKQLQEVIKEGRILVEQTDSKAAMTALNARMKAAGDAAAKANALAVATLEVLKILLGALQRHSLQTALTADAIFVTLVPKLVNVLSEVEELRVAAESAQSGLDRLQAEGSEVAKCCPVETFLNFLLMAVCNVNKRAVGTATTLSPPAPDVCSNPERMRMYLDRAVQQIQFQAIIDQHGMGGTPLDALAALLLDSKAFTDMAPLARLQTAYGPSFGFGATQAVYVHAAGFDARVATSVWMQLAVSPVGGLINQLPPPTTWKALLTSVIDIATRGSKIMQDAAAFGGLMHGTSAMATVGAMDDDVVGAMTVAERDEARARHLCYGCGQPGHSAKDCPAGRQTAKPVKCYGCGELGHIARECRATRGKTGDATRGKTGDAASQLRCYSCNELGHRRADCPKAQRGGLRCALCDKPGHVILECSKLPGAKQQVRAAATGGKAAAAAAAAAAAQAATTSNDKGQGGERAGGK